MDKKIKEEIRAVLSEAIMKKLSDIFHHFLIVDNVDVEKIRWMLKDLNGYTQNVQGERIDEIIELTKKYEENY